MKSKTIHNAILATEKVFMAAYKRHDAKALVALYTKDAKIMPPNTKAVSGAKGMAALFKSFWDAGDTKIKLTTAEADGSGDYGFEVGKYALSNDAAVRLLRVDGQERSELLQLLTALPEHTDDDDIVAAAIDLRSVLTDES